MSFDNWLDDATPADLDSLAQVLLDGRVTGGASVAAIQNAGFGQGTVALLGGLEGSSPKTVAWMLRRLARERRAADDRYAREAHLVWSGDAHDDEAIRDTRVVLDDLFCRAENQVVIATYVIYDGLAVFKALANRMRLKPNLEVSLYVNLFSGTGSQYDEQNDVTEYLDTFRRNHWPSDLRLPNIYYDPETRKLGTIDTLCTRSASS